LVIKIHNYNRKLIAAVSSGVELPIIKQAMNIAIQTGVIFNQFSFFCGDTLIIFPHGIIMNIQGRQRAVFYGNGKGII
jgi:hypothetical protein